ncbi:hypothetical protein HAX54_036116, partial [Datura stramonium]|nr:hypothetical protein [Datura stramonium]
GIKTTFSIPIEIEEAQGDNIQYVSKLVERQYARALKLPISYEELSAITVVETDSKSPLTPSWSPPKNAWNNIVEFK